MMKQTTRNFDLSFFGGGVSEGSKNQTVILGLKQGSRST